MCALPMRRIRDVACPPVLPARPAACLADFFLAQATDTPLSFHMQFAWPTTAATTTRKATKAHCMQLKLIIINLR